MPFSSSQPIASSDISTRSAFQISNFKRSYINHYRVHAFIHTLINLIISILRAGLRQLMRIVMHITGDRINYLSAPELILPAVTVERVFKGAHLLPSLIAAIYIGVKIVPDYSTFYANELEKNSGFIGFSICIIFIPVLILNGLLIEKILDKTNPSYRNFKNDLREMNS